MNNNEVARRFSRGMPNGKGSNLFIEGNTIYSYGYHFPIAKHCPGYILFNSNGYSNSTSKHKGIVRAYLDESEIIECPNCDISQAREYLSNEILITTAKAGRARTNKNSLQLEAERLAQMMTKVLQLI